MEAYNLADAKARLSELVDRVKAGKSVDILRRGRPAARLVPIEPPLKPVDVAALRELHKNLPRQSQGAGDFVRHMRDADRY